MTRDKKRDCHGDVTRDNPVTSHRDRHVTQTVTSRVSHATTTTPHHTTPVFWLPLLVDGSSLIHPLQSVSGHE